MNTNLVRMAVLIGAAADVPTVEYNNMVYRVGIDTP
jgi:hypothetical protein